MNEDRSSLYILVGFIVAICIVGAFAMNAVKANRDTNIEKEKTRQTRITACRGFEGSERILCLDGVGR